jgi:hypothetical protein
MVIPTLLRIVETRQGGCESFDDILESQPWTAFMIGERTKADTDIVVEMLKHDKVDVNCSK